MGSNNDFVLPDPSEKLSYKFILDSLNKGAEGLPESQTLETAAPSEAETEELCGTEAPNPLDPQLEIPTETLEPAVEPQPVAELNLLAGKKYFRIGEVSEILGVEGYVLRYWESEFPNVRPVKASSGHRVYGRKDVETLHLIKHLLYVEKYSIKGAKKRLQEKKKGASVTQQTHSKVWKEIAAELKELISLARAYNP